MLIVASGTRIDHVIFFKRGLVQHMCARPGQARFRFEMMIARCFEMGLRRLFSVSRLTFCFLRSLPGSGLNGRIALGVPTKLIVEITSNLGRNVRLFILLTHGNRLRTCLKYQNFIHASWTLILLIATTQQVSQPNYVQ